MMMGLLTLGLSRAEGTALLLGCVLLLTIALLQLLRPSKHDDDEEEARARCRGELLAAACTGDDDCGCRGNVRVDLPEAQASWQRDADCESTQWLDTEDAQLGVEAPEQSGMPWYWHVEYFTVRYAGQAASEQQAKQRALAVLAAQRALGAMVKLFDGERLI